MTVADELRIVLNPSTVKTAPGGQRVDLRLTIENRSSEAHSYNVELQGLEQGWFSVPQAPPRLFKQTNTTVSIGIHPPSARGVRKGLYPFQVVVRDDAGMEAIERGALELEGHYDYRLDVIPRNIRARGKGTFRVTVSNTGSRDVRLSLSAQDADSACDYRFEGVADDLLVREGQIERVKLQVQPHDRRATRAYYDFSVVARPADAGAAPASTTGRFTPTRLEIPWYWLRSGMIVVALLCAAAALMRFSPWAKSEQVCQLPIVGGGCAPPVPRAQCSYDHGFAEAARVAGGLIGACVTGEIADNYFGNTLQYTKNGVLFWHKRANAVYFFKDNTVYVFNDAGAQRLLSPR